MSPVQAILAAWGICILGALVTLCVPRHKVLSGSLAFAATAISSLLAIAAAAQTLLRGAVPAVTLWSVPRLGSALRLEIDGIAAVFLLLIATLALAALLYSIKFLDHYQSYHPRRFYPPLLLFLAGMYGLVCVTDQMLFLGALWQLMTWPSFVLIRYEFRKPEHCRAAWRYLIMMEIACLLVMLGTALLAQGPAAPAGGEPLASFDLGTLRQGLPHLLSSRPGLVTIAFLLFLLGYGIKAGLWPFGAIWLPGADASAPPPVGSLLSGVTIKLGIYGLIRTFFWLVPPEALPQFPAANWGAVLAIVGTITLFSGTMLALQQEQSLRLLAYHSIGQVGYIMLGLGACLALLAPGPAAPLAGGLAAISFFGALFHTFNHGLFKGLLFLDAGSMWWATGTKDLNKVGGLMRLMPWTAITTLAASFAISGVPLFNGFASKWAIYTAAIQGGTQAGYLPFCALVAIITSALTLASFIKFFGASFLSRTSDLVTAAAVRRLSLEVVWSMRLPQIFLAMACLALGLMPALAYWTASHALDHSRAGLGALLAAATSSMDGSWLGLGDTLGRTVFVPAAVLLVLGVLGLVAHLLAKSAGAPRRAVVPWLCGYAAATDANRYTAHHFYTEIKRYFRWIDRKSTARAPESSGPPSDTPSALAPIPTSIHTPVDPFLSADHPRRSHPPETMSPTAEALAKTDAIPQLVQRP